MRRPDKAFLIAFWEEDAPFAQERVVHGECYSLRGFTIADGCHERLCCDRRISKLTMEHYEGLDLIREETVDAGHQLLREALDQGRSYAQDSVLVPWSNYSHNLQELARLRVEARQLWLQAMALLWSLIGYDMSVKASQPDLDNPP